jgi:hypothetical protein
MTWLISTFTYDIILIYGSLMAKKNYLNDAEFLQAFKRYLPIVKPLREKYEKDCEVLRSQGIKKKDLPRFVRPKNADYEYIGECLLLIAQKLSTKWNFAHYTFKEDMIGDALENAINYLENFDPEKYSKPFAYFTQIIKYSFIRTREEEEQHSYYKQKLIETTGSNYTKQKGDSKSYNNFSNEIKNDIVEKFEAKKLRKKEKAASKKEIKEPVPEYSKIQEFLVEV